MIDLHCHILPALDDGPGTMEGALGMCRALVEDGVKSVVATPHMLTDFYDVTCEQVREGVESLQKEVAEQGLPLEILPGADVLITSDLCDRLRDGSVMTVADGGLYILLELPQDVLPGGLAELLFSVQLLGVTPIITHPERNLEVQQDPSALRPLVEAGNLVQITAASIEGKFGRGVQNCSEELLRRRLAHVVASDAHSHRKRAPGLSRARAMVRDLLSGEEADEIFLKAPSMIVGGEQYEPPETLEVGRGWKWWPFGRG